MENVVLNNGVTMPRIGLGVYKVPEADVYNAVSTALKEGYRAIDTAQYYQNEHGVGKAIRESGIPREELFITTKVWNSHHGYDKTMEAFETSLEQLGLDYLDLYLVHWPVPALDKYIETYQALEKLYADGRVRAIGVSNFHVEHLQRLMDACSVVPVVNQVECHPYFPQKELKVFCKENDIYLEGWAPLFRGGAVLQEKVILDLAENYHKTAAQIVLRWHVQENALIIPKSVTPSRIKENMDVFDFSLTVEEVNAISRLAKGVRIGADPSEMNVVE